MTEQIDAFKWQCSRRTLFFASNYEQSENTSTSPLLLCNKLLVKLGGLNTCMQNTYIHTHTHVCMSVYLIVAIDYIIPVI